MPSGPAGAAHPNGYVSLSDFSTYAPQNLTQNVPTQIVQFFLDAAAGYCAGHMRSQYYLPLIQWGMDFTDAIVAIAVFKLAKRRGYNPEADANKSYLLDYENAVEWCKRVASTEVQPDGMLGSAAPSGQESFSTLGGGVFTSADGSALVYQDYTGGVPRGWNTQVLPGGSGGFDESPTS